VRAAAERTGLGRRLQLLATWESHPLARKKKRLLGSSETTERWIAIVRKKNNKSKKEKSF
jgi:hypothetical protein